MNGIALFGTAAFGSWLLGFVVHHFLVRWNLVDLPNQRSSHCQPTARGGGIGFVTVALGLGTWIAMDKGSQPLAAVCLSAALVSVVSFLDDWRPLSPVIRLTCHTAGALLFLWACSWPDLKLSIGAQVEWAAPRSLGLVLMFLWLTGFTNAFNFMDGINGLAAAQAMFTAFGMGLLCGLASGDWASGSVLLCFALAGAAAGFLPHNFPRARMFMGDVGSAPLGFLLAALGLLMAQQYGWWLLGPLVLLQLNFLLDTSVTLVRRMALRERCFQPHREHFYQKLVRTGRAHSSVTGMEMKLQLVVLMLLLVYMKSNIPLRLVLITAIFGLWALFFRFCETQFRRGPASAPLVLSSSQHTVRPVDSAH